MAEMMQIYKCDACGIMVEVLHDGVGNLVCCDQDMELLDAATTDEGKEKHVPVIEKTADGYQVTVGSVEHPMTEEHHIEWIELVADGNILREHLDPTGPPTASFCIEADSVVARENCNIHGMWKAEA
jgi:superoxide reductase